MATVELHPDNTINIFTGTLTREDTGAELQGGDLQNVTATIYDEDGSSVASTSLSFDSGGEWSGLLGADHGLSQHDIVTLEIQADGGVNLRGTWRETTTVTYREM